MNPIQNISIPPTLAPPVGESSGLQGAQPSFKEFMLEALDHVNSMQQDADHAVEQLMTGEEVNTAEVLTAIQKADLTFRMMLQVRNKLVQAYQEIREISYLMRSAEY